MKEQEDRRPQNAPGRKRPSSIHQQGTARDQAQKPSTTRNNAGPHNAGAAKPAMMFPKIFTRRHKARTSAEADPRPSATGFGVKGRGQQGNDRHMNCDRPPKVKRQCHRGRYARKVRKASAKGPAGTGPHPAPCGARPGHDRTKRPETSQCENAPSNTTTSRASRMEFQNTGRDKNHDRDKTRRAPIPAV